MKPIVQKKLVVRQVIGMLRQKAMRLQSDAYAKKLYAWNTTLLYLEGILSQRKSVDAIADHLSGTSWMQEWTGISSIHGSSLNRRLNQLPTEVLRQTYEDLVIQYGDAFGLPRPMKHLGPLTVVDSTSVTLGRVRGEWAYQQKGQNAVKLHIRLELTGEQSAVPSRAVLSTAGVADLDEEVTETLVTSRDATHLLDRGYIEYGQFLEWNRKGIRFVARLKSNSRVRLIAKRPGVKPPILEDEEVELTDPNTGETGRFRLVTYPFVDKKGKTHRVRALTNRRDVSAGDVAQMYRYRWKVELFFKFMKQQLRLKKMYNAGQQAVWNQIYLNLIAYLLVEMWRQTHAHTVQPGAMIKLLRAYLERPIETLLKTLHRKKKRTSRGRRKKGGRPRIHPKRLKHRRVVYK